MKLGMVIKTSRCIGCDACTISCKTFNKLGPNVVYRKVHKFEVGEYPSAKRRSIPTLCNHCENAACEKVCPTGATYKDEKGRVQVDQDKCIGCRMCIGACPYGARTFNWGPQESYWPATDEPSVIDEAVAGSHRVGAVEKCTMCKDRTDNGLDPLCVHNCPARALVFGDLDDPESEVAKLVGTGKTYTLLPEKGTLPQVHYMD